MKVEQDQLEQPKHGCIDQKIFVEVWIILKGKEEDTIAEYPTKTGVKREGKPHFYGIPLCRLSKTSGRHPHHAGQKNEVAIVRPRRK